jgi:hypothetical protein
MTTSEDRSSSVASEADASMPFATAVGTGGQDSGPVVSMRSQRPQDSASVIPIGEGKSAAPDDHALNETAHTNRQDKPAIPVEPDKMTSPVPDDIPSLVKDATRLIVYLTGSGENPRSETISAVFAANKAIDENAWSIEIGRAFLEAFSELAKQSRPVTAKSLLESDSKEQRAASNIGAWLFRFCYQFS